MDATEQLLEIEAIKRVKARYFRFLDGQDWTGLRTVFADDVRCDVRGQQITGADDWIAWTRSMIEGAKTVHHGHMPEIELTSATEATGIWAMFDYIEPADRAQQSRMGYGHYHETYVKHPERGWLIASMALVRIRVDEFSSCRSDHGSAKKTRAGSS